MLRSKYKFFDFLILQTSKKYVNFNFTTKVLEDSIYRYEWLLNANTKQKQPGAQLAESHYAAQEVQIKTNYCVLRWY